MKKLVLAAIICASALCAAGCAGSAPAAATTQSSVPAATSKSVAISSATSTKTSTPTPTPTFTSTSTPAPAPAPAPAAVAVAVIMPDVTCMNLQTAQDTIQEAGVMFSRSEDGTGAGRMQVSDRNWIVIGQSPSAGSPVGEGEAMLTAVKIGEPNDC